FLVEARAAARRALVDSAQRDDAGDGRVDRAAVRVLRGLLVDAGRTLVLRPGIAGAERGERQRRERGVEVDVLTCVTDRHGGHTRVRRLIHDDELVWQEDGRAVAEVVVAVARRQPDG